MTIGWPLHHGGHLSSTLCLARHLIKNNHIINVMAPTGPMEDEFALQGVTVSQCELFTKKPLWNLLAVPQIIAAVIKGKFDIIHAMDYKSLYPSFIAASILGKPFIFTKAGGTVPSYRIPPCESVIVFSKELLNGMRKKHTNIVNELTLNKARIDTDQFFPDNTIITHKKALHIFMAMRLEEGKRPWLTAVIEGVKQLIDENIDFRFLLAGDGALRYEVEKQMYEINKLQGEGSMQMLGAITSQEEMRTQYNAANIVVGHGRGILEAMACQRPVICLGEQGGVTLVEPSTVEMISEYNFSGRHIKFYPETSNRFSCVIKMLYSNPAKMNDLAEFYKQYISEEYSAKIGAQKLSQIYTAIGTKLVEKKAMVRFSWIGREIILRLKKTITNSKCQGR